MSPQELVIGHYEGTLTSSDQEHLQQLLESSPEVQTMYQRHGELEEALNEDAEGVLVPIGLREATLAVALSGAAETIGGGLSAWLTTKAAAVIGTVIVGGTIAGIVVANSGDEAAPVKSGVEMQEKVATQETLTSEATEGSEVSVVSEPKNVSSETSTQTDPAVVNTNTSSVKPGVGGSTNANGGTANSVPSTTPFKSFEIPSETETKIESPTKVQSGGK